ncbi:tail fiber protein [Paenibacillus glycanilyticus]|uniref:tail fiber protein n=1 Tax=Paenibacillus glycanilyticus TaxID=126569 RepID=UPI0019103DDA|nr:tail fiber protein [Paenibacillus glycanilyticus]
MARRVLIQIRRGLEINIGLLAEGELGYCTDSQKLYIGTSGGNVVLVAAQTAGDMLKSIYDTDNDGKVDAAVAADNVPWSGISNKTAASVTAAGIVQLNSTVTSTSTVQAATASAVKSAYDLASGKLSPRVTWNQLKGV